MMSEHTPGPWVIHGKGNRASRYLAVIDSIPDNEGKVVANCICHVACTNPDADANARLIAAAPTLKDSLIELVDAIDRCGEWDESSRVGEALKNALRILRGFRIVEDAETPVDNQSDDA